MRLIVDMYEHCLHHIPRWNASNICSYHLQEAGATPTQELAFALAKAMGVLDAITGARHLHARRVRALRRPRVVLLQRRHPLRRRDVQAARVRRDVGRDHARPLRRAEPEVPALPLRRAGELARPHRGAAREQRLAHPDRGARRHAEPQRALSRAPAPDLERGAQRCRGRGTSSGRCACSRSSRTRPTCWSTPTSSTARRSSRPRSRR